MENTNKTGRDQEMSLRKSRKNNQTVKGNHSRLEN